MREKDVAIIGMACRVGVCENYEQLWKKLKNSESLIRNFPESRKNEILEFLQYKDKVKFIQSSFLDNVFDFEPEFFLISNEESRYMDPQQRLLLELVEDAFEDAGYNVESIEDRNIGIYVANTENVYSNIIKNDSPLNEVNNLSGISAARVAYTFNLCGPVMNVDTACSSGCVAVNQACKDILYGDISQAVIGGAILNLFPEIKKDDKISEKVKSNTYKTRAFDNNADGFVPGEGAVVFILKDYHKAVVEGDNIHAVIKGSAINNNGRRSNGIAAPSEVAQAEVIKSALKQAMVEPSTISYIEAHGTATEIGDPIEISGIKLAYQGYGIPLQSIGIGSFKTNIGHTGNISGLFNILKVTLMLKHKEYVESLYFEEPNQYIKFESTPVYVCTENSEWETIQGVARRAGVSSLGLTGTNSHIIMEEYIDEKKPSCDKTELVVVTARTKESIENYLKVLKQYILKHKEDLLLKDIAYTLCTGRRNLCFKFAVTVDSIEQLVEKIDVYLSSKDSIRTSVNKANFKNIFVFTDRACCEMSNNDSKEEQDCIKEYVQSLVKLTRELENYSICASGIAGIGNGKIIGEFYKGNMAFEELLVNNKLFEKNKIEDMLDAVRWNKLLDNIIKADYDNLFLIGGNPAIRNVIKAVTKDYQFNNYFFINERKDVKQAVAKLIKEGHVVDWNHYKTEDDCKRVSLPTYPFNKRRLMAEINRVIYMQTMDNNKIDASKYMAATDESVKEVLEGMFTSVVNKEYDCSDYIYDIGINSYEIMQFIAKVKNRLGISTGFAVFYEGHTIGEIFNIIEQNMNVQDGCLDIVDNKKPETYDKKEYPASVYQKRMYMMEKMFSKSLAYNSPFLYKLDMPLDEERLTQAVYKLLDRHKSLKTIYRIKDGELYQVVLDELIVDLSFDKIENYESYSDFARKKTVPFDLEHGPVFRLAVAQSDNFSIILMDVHHICSDGQSFAVILPELMKTYLGIHLTNQVSQYYEYSQWQYQYFKTEEYKKKEEYWINLFKKDYKQFELPTDYERKEISCLDGAVEYFNIDGSTWEKIQKIKSKYELTELMFYLGTMSILVSKYSNQEDIVIGTTVTGRSNEQFARTVGLFRNTLPIRVDVDEKLSFSKFIQNVKRNIVLAYENQDYPFENLLNHYYDRYNKLRNPIVDIIMVMQNVEGDEKEDLADVNMTSLNMFQGSTRFDMTIHLYPQKDSLNVKLKYFSGLFKKETILLFIEKYLEIIELLVNHEEIILHDISINRNKDESIISGSVKKNDKYHNVIELFEANAEKYKNKTAITTGGNTTNYGQLKKSVNHLASYIYHSLGTATQKRIGLLVKEERFAECALAVMKSGNAFVPMDNTLSVNFLDNICEAAKLDGLIYQKEATADLSWIIDKKAKLNICFCLDDKIENDKYENICLNIHPEDETYIIFTSGTTDCKKGVPVKHKSLLNYVEWFARKHKLEEEDKTILLSPVCFDLCYSALFTSILYGRELCIIHKERYMDADILINYINENHITYLKLTPTLLSILVNQIEETQNYTANCVKLVVLGGEKLIEEDIKKASSIFSNSTFVNHYGPTEVTIGSSSKAIDIANIELDNIGQPIDNTIIAIVDKSGNIVSKGTEGEIAISGMGVLNQYIGEEDDIRFAKLSVDGCKQKFYLTCDKGVISKSGDIYIKGRTNRSVKVNGYQVDLEAIDRVISKVEYIKNSYTDIVGEGIFDKKIISVISVTDGYKRNCLTEKLKQQLPVYLLPDEIIVRNEVAIGYNNKSNNRELIKNASLECVTNEDNLVEQALMEIWSDVLQVKVNKIDKDFFILGGKSIKAVILCQRIKDVFHIKYEIYDVFLYRTIKSQAKVIKHMINDNI